MSNKDKERARAMLSGIAPNDQRFAPSQATLPAQIQPETSPTPEPERLKEINFEINKEENTPTPTTLSQQPTERRRGRPALPQSEDPMEAFSNRIRRSLHRKMKLYAVQSGKSIQEVLDEALERYLG